MDTEIPSVPASCIRAPGTALCRDQHSSSVSWARIIGWYDILPQWFFIVLIRLDIETVDWWRSLRSLELAIRPEFYSDLVYLLVRRSLVSISCDLKPLSRSCNLRKGSDTLFFSHFLEESCVRIWREGKGSRNGKNMQRWIMLEEEDTEDDEGEKEIKFVNKPKSRLVQMNAFYRSTGTSWGELPGIWLCLAAGS